MLSMRVNLWPGKTDWQKIYAMRCTPWQALILLLLLRELIGEKMDPADEGVTSDELMEKIGRVEQMHLTTVQMFIFEKNAMLEPLICTRRDLAKYSLPIPMTRK